LARLALATLCLPIASAAFAASSDDIDRMQDLVSRVGPVIGSASACPGIGQHRIDTMAAKFRTAIASVPETADRDNLDQLFDHYLADGRSAVASGKVPCDSAEQQFATMEQAVSTTAPSAPPPGPPAAAVPGPPAAAVPSPPTAAVPPPATPPSDNGDHEIRFGMVAPFSGHSHDIGRQMEIGITAAFNRINDAGGINGKTLRLVVADDGYEPSRTLNAMKTLTEKDHVLAFIGNYGTATGAIAMNYALEQRILFFAPFSGSNIFRKTPPDRYVFNYRASYDEEMDAVVRYLIRVRHLQPRQIAVFAQDDAYGEAGYLGVARTFRTLGLNEEAILRINYKRNTLEVDDAINTLRRQKPVIKAVIMVATYRAAARFVEKTRDILPDLIYTNTSLVGSTQLANELMLLGSRFAAGIIVTQVLPAIGDNSTEVLEYRDAIAKYFPNVAQPDYISFEGYVAASILIEGLKRTPAPIDNEKLITSLEAMRNFDLGVGPPLSFGRAQHQASHEVWGSVIDSDGNFQPLELK